MTDMSTTDLTDITTQILNGNTARHWISRRRIGLKTHDLATAQIVPGTARLHGIAQVMVTDSATLRMVEIFDELTVEDAAARLERQGFKPAVYVTVAGIREPFTVETDDDGVISLRDEGGYYGGRGYTFDQAIAEAEAMLVREVAAEVVALVAG